MSFTFIGGVVTHTVARKNFLVEFPSRMKKIKDSWQKRIAGHDNEIPEQLLFAFLCLALVDIQRIRTGSTPVNRLFFKRCRFSLLTAAVNGTLKQGEYRDFSNLIRNSDASLRSYNHQRHPVQENFLMSKQAYHY